jgi:hypothetical protein
MTEAQVRLGYNAYKNAIKSTKTISTQTGETNDLYIYLENKKTGRLYFSPVYKEYVLSINFGTAKSFIFTKLMWKKFRTFIPTIDKILQ